jgi:thiol:disulfide interchange protein DsbD
VKWSFSARNISPGESELVMTATIDEGWHLYSQFIDEGGPVATSFTFDSSSDYSIEGKVEEKSKVIETFDKTFNMDIAYFEHKAVFSQKIKLSNTATVITGSVEFMVCNDSQCLPPEEREFSIEVKNAPAVDKSEKAVPETSVKRKLTEAEGKVSVKEEFADAKEDAQGILESKTSEAVVKDEEISTASASQTIKQNKSASGKDNKSLWTIFIAGIVGGFAAFFMPCIFPMLPFTVSYFTKSNSKQNAFVQAFFYGIFIIVIYVALGLLITMIFGADALNNLATNGIFNLLFFILLVVFAFSFFGAFELVLPSSWGNKTDSKTERGGFLGLFFMAATLSIVSFSCTGPIIGTLLVEAATMGHLMGPAVGMFGFALALALPFTFFSMFPSWLKSMPKSGGWLNSVKVVLGFLELALALKFLSNVDLAYHWNWFDREVFLVLWISISGLLALYLLGKLRLPHDSEITHISPFRLMLAIITIAFTVYLIPGLWGAPLKSVAAFLPPMQSQDFDLYTPSLGGGATSSAKPEHSDKKYSDIFHAPYGLDAYFDYEEGVAMAKKENKPIMIDFTGHACVNCRKMEATVWSDKNVLDLLRNEYVLIQLYVDDKTELPESEQTVSAFSGKKIKTIGNKWSDYQASKFNSNSQPYYVLLDPEENLLITPQGAEYDVDKFAEYLKTAIEVFKNK